MVHEPLSLLDPTPQDGVPRVCHSSRQLRAETRALAKAPEGLTQQVPLLSPRPKRPPVESSCRTWGAGRCGHPCPTGKSQAGGEAELRKRVCAAVTHPTLGRTVTFSYGVHRGGMTGRGPVSQTSRNPSICPSEHQRPRPGQEHGAHEEWISNGQSDLTCPPAHPHVPHLSSYCQDRDG